MSSGSFRLRLAHRLTGLATATSVVSVLVPGLILVQIDERVRRREFIEGARVLTEGVATNNAAALAFGDARAIDESLNSLSLIDQRVIGATAYLTNGQVLATHKRPSQLLDATWSKQAALDAPGTTAASYVFGPSTLTLIAPVTVASSAVGTLLVDFSTREMAARNRASMQLLAATVAATFAVAWLVGWRLQRIISAPLLRLAGFTRAVTHNSDYSTRAVRESSDEIGDVVDAFNAMLDSVQTRDRVLAEQRLGLEQAVADRTAELAASGDRFRRLVENTNTVPWEADAHSLTVAYVAPQVAQLFGAEGNALIGTQVLWDLTHEADRPMVTQQLAELAARTDGSGADFAYRVKTLDHRTVDVRAVASVHHLADGTSVFRGIFTDVTEQKRLGRERLQAQKLESIGRLASGVAHEINTPVQFVSDSVHFVRDAMVDIARLLATYRDALTAVAGGAAAADAVETVAHAETEADLDYLLENVPKALERSLDGLNRVAVIVRSMKDFAHPDQTAMAEIDLNRAIESTLVIACNEYKYVADIETRFGDLPLVACHAGEINQVILNLIVNAAHAIGDTVRDSGRKGRITVTTAVEDHYAVVSIGDTGGGIPESIRDRIFDPFFTTKEVGRGTGQGLAIARACIQEKHGGRLDFESESGEGTTFHVRLPLTGAGRRVEGVAA